MLISSLPQAPNLPPLFPAPAHLETPQFIGNAIVHDGYSGRRSSVSLYQCNRQHVNGVSYVVAVYEFGSSYVLYTRKMFNINASVADDIRKMSSVASVVFRSEWL